MLTSSPNESEILWNFCRYPSSSRKRITLVENPHFYEYQSPNAYWDGFTTGPMESYRYAENIYVLTNTRSRIFLEFGIGKDSRVFDNVWQTNGVFIFKSLCLVVLFFLSPFANIFSGICGKLEGERIIKQLLGNGSWEWCHEVPPPSQQPARLTVHSPHPRSTTRSSTTATPAWNPVQNLAVLIHYVLFQDAQLVTKIRIRNRAPSRGLTIP